MSAGPSTGAGNGGDRDGGGEPIGRSDDCCDAEVVLRRLSSFWTAEPHAVPTWAAQELTFGQLRLLFQLQQHGGAAPVSRIAEWLAVGLPAASGVIDRVERHGLVERQHRQDDRRIVECRLTERGDALLAEIVGMRDEAMRRVLSRLTRDELGQLDRLLAIVQTRMAPSTPPWTGAGGDGPRPSDDH